MSAAHSLPVEVRQYDHLFSKADPLDVEDGQDYQANLNPDSLTVLKSGRVEPSVAATQAGQRYQFERLGYFCVDPDSRPDALVFNRTVTLKDTWAKIKKKS